MYKKILVPLDGSKLAECALPRAEELLVYEDQLPALRRGSLIARNLSR